MTRPMRYTQEMVEEYYAKGYWTDDTTSRLWAYNAKHCPDKEAYVSAQKRLTWSQVKTMSDRLAWGFLEMGLRKDDLLLILLENCCESYIVRVACEKAGILCATALMTLRESEIEYILRNFEAVGAVIPRRFRKFEYFDAIHEMQMRLPCFKHIFLAGNDVVPGTVSLEEMMQQPWEEKYGTDDFSKTEITATEISVIACTSGTTGIPKGVEHTQCARMALARSYRDRVRLHTEDIVLNVVNSVAGLGAGFCYNGATALVGAKSILLDVWNAEEAFRLIEKEKATVLLAVPAQLAQMLRDPKLSEYDLSSLRCIRTGTAPLPYDLATEVEERMKVRIINGLGHLDGGIATQVSIDDPPIVRRGTVGKPEKGMVIKLIDDEGKETEKGEIVYSGPTMSGGYYKDPELTLKAWGSLGLEGFLKTGDLGQFDAEGNLIFIGRKKDIIIRGGQNIYPTEIEGLLLTHPKIKDVALVSMPDPIMGEKACAYVALHPGETLTFEEMTSFLKSKKIAPYKVPERLEVLPELPVRGHQKVAKNELEKDIIRKLQVEAKL